VLEGSVRRAGDRIRVTAELISAKDGSHLYSERYDRVMADVFALQDEIAAAITAALRLRLSPQAPPQRYTPKLAAYEAYLKAKYHEAKTTPESLDLSKQYYEQAIALDPGFALARAGLSYYHVWLAIFGWRPAHEAVVAARAEAQRALDIDPALPEAHAMLGYMATFYDLDFEQAELHFGRALAHQPDSAVVRPLYGQLQFLRGNVEKAIEIVERVIEEDPLEVWPRMNLHAYLQAVGRDTEALEQVNKVLELNENLPVARVSLAWFHADRGALPEALAAARRANAVAPWYPDATATLAALLRRNGDEGEAQRLFHELGPEGAAGDCRCRAIFHLLCGEVDQGADWAEKAIEQRDLSMMFYLRFVVCKELRASTRWAKIAGMIHLPATSGPLR
jgi:serine/threonine-protein kinase